MNTLLIVTLLAFTPQSLLDLAGDTNHDQRISFTDSDPETNESDPEKEDTNAVIILNNCDNDQPDKKSTPDNADDIINGEHDLLDLEPIIVRRTGVLPDDAEITLQLALRTDDNIPFNDIELVERFRIFDKQGTEVIGPETGTSYLLTARQLRRLENDPIVFYVESLAFRTSAEISVILNGAKQDSLFLESAPFILMPNNLGARQSYIVQSDAESDLFESMRFVHDFSKATRSAGLDPTCIHDDEGDLWIQDECNWGYTETPRTRMPVVLHMLRQSGYGIPTDLAADVIAMMGPDTGYFEAFDYPPDSTTLDIGGNLEVTPPTDDYPFGRVYYGSVESSDSRFKYFKREINEGFQRFFERQAVQDPIGLTTDWLVVGHVDELVTFIPQDDGMKMLISSPGLALEILRGEGPTHPLNSNYRNTYGLSNVGQMLGLKYAGLGLNATQLNMEADYRLFGVDHDNPSSGSVKRIFMDELKLKEEDIIEVPILYKNFMPESEYFCVVAQTPALVNLYCMERDVLVPRPFMPAIARHFEASMAETGTKIHWIDDWDLYHVAYGEIHCGTNARRGYFGNKWWKSNERFQINFHFDIAPSPDVSRHSQGTGLRTAV